MERLKQRLEISKRAVASFRELLTQPAKTLVERDAAIQRFEYTVEAVWRLAQRYLEVVEGQSAGSPKGVIRLCREVKLLTDDQATLALEMIDDRNLTVHTYHEQLAQQIYSRLSRYATLVQQWLDVLEARLAKQR